MTAFPFRYAALALSLAIAGSSSQAMALDSTPAATGTSSTDQQDRRIADLIAQLGDSDYAVRERAQRELTELSFTVFDALSEAENSDDIEIASQARYLVRLIRVDWIKESDPPEVRQILKDYDQLAPQQRLERIDQLAELTSETGVQWLTRIVRFEQSQVLSKRAAMAIVSQEVELDDAGWQAREQLIAKLLDRSKRPGAQWLRTYVRSRQEPAVAADQWAEHVKAERRTLQERPHQSHHTLVLDLMRRQVELYDQLSRSEEALAVMRRMVTTERGDSESLSELVQWFVSRQAWTAIDELATRFARTFDADPVLLYTLAEARSAQGKPGEAEEVVQRALKINGDKGPDHIIVGMQLQERGLQRWAEREFLHVIATAPASYPGVLASFRMSEIYHDRLDEKSAAEVLDGALAVIDKDKNLSRLVQQRRELNELKARRDYYWAKHYENQKDDAKMVEHLEKALGHDKTDADVLIAMYRLPTATSEFRERVKKQIKDAADIFRKAIEADADDATPYNQFAWLIGNTEGDMDEAIRFSQRSIEILRASEEPANRRGVAGYLDTLAHCYNGKKDYENAVRTQAEAHKLDPQSQAIKRQLDVFKQSLADQQPSN